MDVFYFFRVLMKRKWIIIGSAILASVVAWYFTRNEPKSYRSSARISTGFAVADEIKVNDNFSAYDADIKFNNATNTWMSPSVVSLVSYELILHDLNSSNPFRRLNNAQRQSDFYKSINIDDAKRVFMEKLESMTVLTSYKPEEKKLLEFLDMYGYSYKYLIGHFQITQVQRTDYIQTECTTENPELSAFIVNNLFKQFLRYYRNIRSVKSQESIDTLQSIMDKKKQDWDEKNKQLKGEGLVDVATENASKVDLISEYQKDLTEEKNRQTDNQFALRNIRQRLDVGTTQATTTPTSPSNTGVNNEELIMARKAMNEAYADYLKTNDKDKLTRYYQLKSEYDRKYAASVSPDQTSSITTPDKRNDLLEKKNELEVAIASSDEKIKAIQQNITSLRASVSSVSSKGANVETILEEAKLAEKDYFEAKQKYSNALDVSASTVNNFRQLQIAQPAIEPEPSKRMIVVGMAGALTFVSVVLIIIFVTYLDSSLRTPGIFSRAVNLKLISIINFVNLKNKALMDIVTGHTQMDDVHERQRNNVFRESIRKLRYEIEHSNKRIFLFTSTTKGQGKTTLIQAVSFSLCMSRKRILIIDTNFSNNDLTINLQADPVLEKISDQNNAMPLKDKIRLFSKGVTVEPGGGELFIIGSEGGDYTPSEILPRENLLTNLHSLLPDFDYIFLEGPPLNDFTDSKELIHYVDGVVAVFSARHVIKQIDKESIRFFHELNGKFTGSVLNMIDLENVNAI